MNRRLKIRHIRIVIVLMILLSISIVISINAGYTDLQISEIVKVLIGQGTAKNNMIILDFRLPRIIIAILVGMGFSLSGVVLQGLVRNPLASPGLIGINAGAGLVVIIFIVIGGTLSFSSIMALPMLSLLGAALTGIIIYRLSSDPHKGIHPTQMVLNGIAIQAGINAVMTIIVMKLDENQYEFLAKWQAGSIWNSNWEFVKALSPWIILGFAYLIFKAKHLDILVMGDDISQGLGLKVLSDKKKLLFTAIALAASSVAISGSISFVGLMAPHLTRRLVGARHRILIPTSALIGGLLVLSADTVARTIIEPAEFPTGILVSVIGAPYFLYLLIKQRKGKA